MTIFLTDSNINAILKLLRPYVNKRIRNNGIFFLNFFFTITAFLACVRLGINSSISLKNRQRHISNTISQHFDFHGFSADDFHLIKKKLMSL